MAKQPPLRPLECSECHCPMGDKAKVLAVMVDGEPWCPTCFCFKRANMEPGRWQAAAPVQCGACRSLSTSFGPYPTCACCQSRAVLIVVPHSLVQQLLEQV